MTDETFKWVIAIAVLIVFISNLVVLWLMYGILKPLAAKLQATSDRINPILGEAQGIMGNVKNIIAENQPVVHDIATKANDKINPILNETQGILSNAKSISGTISSIAKDAQPAVQGILTKTNERIDPILHETQGILSNAKGMTSTVSDMITTDVKPVIQNVAAKTNSMTDMVHTQATEIRALMHDTVLPTAKNQVERVDNLVKRTTDKIDATTAALGENLIEPVTRTSSDITNMLYDQVNEISTLIQDTVLKVRNQVEQLDDLVRRTGGTVDSSITNLERRVTNPVREVNYMEAAIRKGLSVLFNKNRQ